MWKVQLFELNYDEREVEAVADVVRSGWITMGPKTSEFEDAFGRQLDGHRCTAVSSGTAALHLAILALDLEPGDEVIVPALTFVADANVVRMAGAIPVFADCESIDNWNVGVESIRERITGRTRAVICVHYAGYACRMNELRDLCDENALALSRTSRTRPAGPTEIDRWERSVTSAVSASSPTRTYRWVKEEWSPLVMRIWMLVSVFSGHTA